MEDVEFGCGLLSLRLTLHYLKGEPGVADKSGLYAKQEGH